MTISKILPVIWHDQRNNTLYPFGTCNATSIAMVMQYKNIFGGWDGTGQLDDYVTRQLDTSAAWIIHKKTLPTDWHNCNPRNNPFVLRWYLSTIGIDDRFYQYDKDKSTLLGLIRDSIDRDMPVIMAGNYQRQRWILAANIKSGEKILNRAIKLDNNEQKEYLFVQDTITHINVAVGYDDNNIIVNDPFGSALNYYLPYENDGDHVAYPNGFINHVTQLHILTI